MEKLFKNPIFWIIVGLAIIIIGSQTKWFGLGKPSEEEPESPKAQRAMGDEAIIIAQFRRDAFALANQGKGLKSPEFQNLLADVNRKLEVYNAMIIPVTPYAKPKCPAGTCLAWHFSIIGIGVFKWCSARACA